MKTIKIISKRRLYRLREQGYREMSDNDLSALAFGNRFAYIVCSILLITGVVAAGLPILAAMFVVAVFGVILPNHPFDYIYNYLLASILKKPKLKKRSKQLKFACTIATVWIGITIYLFSSENYVAGYIMGGLLSSVAMLVSVFDICIPSMIYNYIFKIKIENSHVD